VSDAWPWAALVLLGAYHGINPGMGWLFAVALGLQERRRKSVLQALLPIALGHAASIAVVVAVVGSLEAIAPPRALRTGGALALIAFGLFKFVKPRAHPRWVGMRVGGAELAVWSFLMATAHGAGLMLFPVLLAFPTGVHAGHAGHLQRVAGAGSLARDGAAVLVHTAAMLMAMAAVALVVYEKLGLAILRRAWINLDLVWAIAIVVAGLFTLFT
jgi:hypothetical protein